jgi:hypothetical protein
VEDVMVTICIWSAILYPFFVKVKLGAKMKCRTINQLITMKQDASTVGPTGNTLQLLRMEHHIQNGIETLSKKIVGCGEDAIGPLYYVKNVKKLENKMSNNSSDDTNENYMKETEQQDKFFHDINNTRYYLKHTQ